MLNALTVDVEDWPQSTLDRNRPITERVVYNTLKLLDILEKKNITATFFVLGLVAEKFPEVVERIKDAGHELATHGYSHKLIFTQKPEEFRMELRRSIALIEDIAAEKVLGHRAPDFSIIKESLWALDVLQEEGILYDSSIFPIRGNRYGISNVPRFPYYIGNSENKLFEIPLSTIRVLGINIPFAGGGYFRFYPYEFTKWAIKRWNDQGHPIMVYLHPYELDMQELRSNNLKVPLKLKFSQGFNRGKMENRLYRLLSDFEFAPIRDVFSLTKPEMI